MALMLKYANITEGRNTKGLNIMKTTKIKYLGAYMVLLLLVGCASSLIRGKYEVAKVTELLEEDRNLHLDDISICTNCGFTHDCQEWREFQYFVEDLELIMEEEVVEDNLPPTPLPMKNITPKPPQ